MKDNNIQKSLFIKRYLIAGVIAILPLVVTWVVIEFLVGILSQLGTPVVQLISISLRSTNPELSSILVNPWFETILAVASIVVILYLIGRLATNVVGQKVIKFFEHTLNRLPIIQAIYGTTKKIIVSFKGEEKKAQRVVLIDFPSEEMKTIGFLTRTLIDRDTGAELAVVYVPTTPNPTSGYMEIVPLEKVTLIDWSLEQAMSFVISGGTITPDFINYHSSFDPNKIYPSNPTIKDLGDKL